MKLEQGKEYTIKKTEQICHAVSRDGIYNMTKEEQCKAIFVGEIIVYGNRRNIFYGEFKNQMGPNYIMFGAKDIDYIVDAKVEEKAKLVKELKTLQLKIQKYEKDGY